MHCRESTSLRICLMAGVNHRARSHKCKLILNIISLAALINCQHPLMVTPDLFRAPLNFCCPWGQGKCLPQAPKAVNLSRSDGSFLPTLTPEFSETSMNIRVQRPSELSCRLPKNKKVKKSAFHSQIQAHDAQPSSSWRVSLSHIQFRS